MIQSPQVDLPRGFGGGSDIWDAPQASVVLDADYFTGAAPPAEGITGSLSATESGSDTITSTGAVAVAGQLTATEAGADGATAAGAVVVAGALAALCGKIDVWLLATLAVPRGATADVLARAVAPLGGRVELFASPELALQRAVGLAGEDDRIAAFGSFYTVAAVKRVLQTVKNTVSPP